MKYSGSPNSILPYESSLFIDTVAILLEPMMAPVESYSSINNISSFSIFRSSIKVNEITLGSTSPLSQFREPERSLKSTPDSAVASTPSTSPKIL